MKKDPHLGNKIFGATLAAAWVIMISVFAGSMLYGPDEDTSQHAFRIAGTETEAPAAAVAATVEKPAADIATLLASADADAGTKVAKKCTACHSLDQGGANKVGPNLWNIVQRPVAGADGFKYSAALAGMGGNWSYEALSGFLNKPKEFAPGTRMSFAGIGKDSDRANLIAYLRTLSDNPAPLP